jgi:hypothetical protein
LPDDPVPDIKAFALLLVSSINLLKIIKVSSVDKPKI